MGIQSSLTDTTGGLPLQIWGIHLGMEVMGWQVTWSWSDVQQMLRQCGPCSTGSDEKVGRSPAEGEGCCRWQAWGVALTPQRQGRTVVQAQ